MERAGSEHPVLIGQTGPLNGQSWLVGQDNTIGRDQTCSIIVPDRQVSRFHARLSLEEEGVTLEDMGSKNGTFCNGEVIEGEIVLQDGDVVQVALVQEFVFLSADATIPLKGDLPGRHASRRLRLDERSRRVWINEEEIDPPLSGQQFKLMQCLYENQGKVVSRHDLIISVWGVNEAVDVSEQALDALVRRLRDRLGTVDSSRAYVVTVRGHGLRLDNPT